MVVKSYRGLVEDEGQDKIRLTTTDGRMGYRIKNFQIMGLSPVVDEIETVMKIYLKEQALGTISLTVNFTDTDLIAAAITTSRATARSYPINQLMILDNMIFNQDIYITMKDDSASTGCNYILDLEEIKLSSAQAEVLIVKDLRKQPWTRP